MLKCSITLMLRFTHHYLHFFFSFLQQKLCKKKPKKIDFHTVKRIYVFNWRCMLSRLDATSSVHLVTVLPQLEIQSGRMGCFSSSQTPKINKHIIVCIYTKEARGKSTSPLDELYCPSLDDRTFKNLTHL